MTPHRPAPGLRSPSGGAVRPDLHPSPVTPARLWHTAASHPSPSQAGTNLNTNDTHPRGVDAREATLALWRAEQARRTEALAAVRAHLEEQPSAHSVRTCARYWCSDVMSLAEEIAGGLPC